MKISDVLKITIPAYDADEVTYEITAVQTPGGTISVDKTEAKEGDTVKVTVTPDSGKQMIAGTLKFSWDQAPYTVQDIDESTMTFTMPASGGSVSCRFEEADSGSSGSSSTKTTVSAFQINGANGTVNDTAGTISIVLPYNTDLTSLTPVIALGNNAESISPASGTTVDLSKPVTYTVTMADGTTKIYTVTAYTEEAPKSEKLWEKVLEQMGGSSSSNSWWKKAKEFKEKGKYPVYW